MTGSVGKHLLRWYDVWGTVLHSRLLAVIGLSIPCLVALTSVGIAKTLIGHQHLFHFLSGQTFYSIHGCWVWHVADKWYRVWAQVMCHSRPGPEPPPPMYLSSHTISCSLHSLMSSLGKKDIEKIIESIFSDQKANDWTWSCRWMLGLREVPRKRQEKTFSLGLILRSY